MSSPEAAPVPGPDCYVDGEKQSQGLCTVPGPLERSETEESLPDPAGSELPLPSQLEGSEARAAVLWTRGDRSDSPGDDKGRPGTPMEETVAGLDFLPPPVVETPAIQQETKLERAGPGHPSAESVRGDLGAGPSRRGLQTPNCEEAKPASPTFLYPKGLEQGRAWVTPEKSTASRMTVSEDQHAPSEPESAGEFNEIRMMRRTVCLKDGDQAKSSGLAEAGDLARPSTVQARDNFVRMPASLLASTPRALTSGMERQASKELEAFSLKKRQGAAWSKGGGKPSYQEATATGAAGLPKASPRKKTTQKKRPLWDTSAVTLGRAFHHWGQRLKSAPVEPATFPPLWGVGLPGRSKKCSLLPLRPKQCKNCYTGKRSGRKRTGEFQLVNREDTDATRDPSSQAQLPTFRAEPPSQTVLQEEFSSGDPNTRGPHDPGSSQALALSQRNVESRRSEPSGDQEPPVGSPPPDPEMQQLPGTQGCPHCPELQKEVEDLKKQLAAMQALNEKFQALSS